MNAPTSSLTRSLAPRASEAVNVTENGVPIEGSEANQCNGDIVPYHGKLSTAFIVSGGLVTHERLKFHLVFDGVGLPSGSTYHGTDEFEQDENSSLLPFEFTNERNVRMTSNTAPDMYLHYLFHFTVNGVGQLSASIEKGNPVLGDCKGL